MDRTTNARSTTEQSEYIVGRGVIVPTSKNEKRGGRKRNEQTLANKFPLHCVFGGETEWHGIGWTSGVEGMDDGG